MFAANTRFGQQDALYRRTALLSEIAYFRSAWFFTVHHNDVVVGCYVIDERHLQRAGQPVSGLYRGLLAIAPRHRRRGLARRCVRVAVEWALRHCAEIALSYGCVDANNEASIAMLASAGMRHIGTQGSVLKYHQWQRHVPARIAITEALTDSAASLRESLLAGDSLFDRGASETDEWITATDGSSLAACRHRLVTLNLDPMQGVAGIITEHLLDAFPPGRRRFDPRAFRYIAMNDAIASGPDATALFGQLTRYLMARHEVHFVNVSLDDGDGSDSTQSIRASLGRRRVANRRRIHVLGQWHKKTPDTEVPGALMLLSAPDL